MRRVPLGVLGVLIAVAITRALANDFWDDALFFQRIAWNLLHHGTAAWNVSDGPVYGSTSQLFQLMATLLLAAAPGHAQAATKAFLGLSLLVAAVCSARFVIQRSGPSGVVVLLCGFLAPPFLALIASGMETLFALALLAGYFVFLPAPRTRGLWAFVLVGVMLVWASRPDLVLLIAAPTAALLWERGRPLIAQRSLFVAGASAIVGLLLFLAVMKLCYGTAFPLSFHLKTQWLSSYDDGYRALGLEGERRQLATFVAVLCPFVVIALFQADALGRALLLSALGFVVYHQLSTVGVMGYHARFLLPAALPVLLAAGIGWPRFLAWSGARATAGALLPIWLAGLALAYHRGWIERPDVDFYLGWVTAAEYGACVLPTAALLGLVVIGWSARAWWLVPAVALAAAVLPGVPSLPPQDDASGLTRIASRMGALTGIYEVKRCLREPLHVYHSELGVTGMLFLESKVTDLSGLMNPRLAFGRPPFDDYCLPDLPEVIFLPHRTHVRFNEEIAQSKCLERYRHPEWIPRSSSTLYLREDLRCEPAP